MKYLIFEDFSGEVIPIIFPERILHEEMREQIPYSKVVSGGYVFLENGEFICTGKVKELSIASRQEDSQIIGRFFYPTKS
ncbi:hypothetical protein JCM13304A_15870 [Desulfothermus okinawensis JCM 13304]